MRLLSVNVGTPRRISWNGYAVTTSAGQVLLCCSQPVSDLALDL